MTSQRECPTLSHFLPGETLPPEPLTCGTWQMWSVGAFMSRIDNLIPAPFEFQGKFAVSHLGKLSARPDVPLSVSLEPESSVAKIEG